MVAPAARPQTPAGKPLRIALLDSVEGWGGGEKWCVEAALALRARGHGVWIAAPGGSRLLERAREAELPAWSAGLGLLGGWPLGASLRFARFLARERIESVIGNVGRDLRMAAPACRISRAALLQRRGLLRPVRSDPLTRWLYRHEVCRVIVNSPAIEECMRAGNDFLAADRFVCIPNGIDTARPARGDAGRLRRELGIAAEQPLVGIVGRLSPMKGHADLLRVWPRVREAHPSAVLLLVGDGELRAELEAQVASVDARDSVRFLGFRRDLDDLYEALDLFVLASRRDEGCNNALLEAMWHGKASVVTDCGGLAEIVESGRSGVVVAVGDGDALALAVVRLLADPAERARLGQGARALVSERYSLRHVTDRLETLLLGLREDRAR